MKVLPAIAILVIAATSAQAQSSLPFVGKWDCEVSEFTFNARSYNNGSKTLPFKSIEIDGNNFLLSFRDGYRISLFDVKAKTMTWHSPISGDTFNCTRIR